MPARIAVAFAALAAPLSALAAVSPETGRWVPGIGDPTLFGWLTVGAYLLAAVLAATAVPHARNIGGFTRFFWVTLTVSLFALAVNKQLDLQSWFSQAARDLAISQGWYESRRELQVAFIAALAASGIVVLALARAGLAKHWREYSLVCTGLTGLTVFIVVRAATFHDIDTLLGVSFAGVRTNVILEIGSIALVCLGVLKWKSQNITRWQ